MKQKKFPYIPVSVAVTHILTVVAVMIGVAMYGNSMKILGNLLVEISGFDQLSTEIGRMEWTALFAVIVMGAIEISFLFYGLTECSVRLVKSKYPAVAVVVAMVILLSALLSSPQIIADWSHSAVVGGIMLALSLLLPIYFLVVKGIYKSYDKKSTQNKELTGEAP